VTTVYPKVWSPNAYIHYHWLDIHHYFFLFYSSTTPKIIFL
jgi:hypothetical protein